MQIILLFIIMGVAALFGHTPSVHESAIGFMVVGGIEELGRARALIGTYFVRLESVLATSIVPILAMRSMTDQEIENYKWLGNSPIMREWIGGRQVKGLTDNGFTIKNKTFEVSLGVNVDDLRRDKTTQTTVRIQELADNTVAHPLGLLTTLIEAGPSTTCYDGQYFYDTDHKEGKSGTQSNDITSAAVAPTVPTAAEYSTAILAGIQRLMGIKNDQGQPMNENAKSFLVMVPASHMVAAAGALNAPVLVNAAGAAVTNLITSFGGFTITLKVNARLSATDSFTIHRVDAPVKPFIHQVEMDPFMSMKDDTFDNNQYVFGVKSIENVGYGLWQYSCLVTFV